MARLPKVDYTKETSRIAAFIEKVVGQASAKGVVVGLSGGIDSSVVGALCARALGRSKVLGLLLPSDHTPPQDIKDAAALAGSLGISYEKIPISRIVEAVNSSARIRGTRIARANVEARVRMTILYFHANTLGYLVAGTDDRSENLLGYFSKWGDGGVDFLPISHLYKTQVRELGRHLGLPEAVVAKPASPQLWPGHKASDEIPAEYGSLDLALHAYFDLNASPEKAAFNAGLPVSVMERVLEMHRKTEHKRSMPPSLS